MATSLTKPLVKGPNTGLLSCGRGFGGGAGGGDDGGGGGGPDRFVPNCLLGTNPEDIVTATVPPAIGIQDSCLEIWAMPFGSGPNRISNFNAQNVSGAFTQSIAFDLGDGAGAAPVVRALFYRGVPPGGQTIGGAVNVEPGWRHYAVNFDRSANMTLYVDGVAGDITDISFAVADNIDWLRGFEIQCQRPFAVGPFAYHLNTLLTGVQMADSRSNRSVQQLAATIVRFNPRFVVGQTGWDSIPANLPNELYLGSPGGNLQIPIPFGSPEGVNGTVFLPDLSGNADNMALTTLASYSTTAQASVSFGEDPFWY